MVPSKGEQTGTPRLQPSGVVRVHGLGMLAVLSAAIGRMASPLAGGLILATGFAGGVSPVEVAKRTGAAALPLLVAVWFLF